MKTSKSKVNGISYLVNEKENGVINVTIIVSQKYGIVFNDKIEEIVKSDFPEYDIEMRENSLSFKGTVKPFKPIVNDYTFENGKYTVSVKSGENSVEFTLSTNTAKNGWTYPTTIPTSVVKKYTDGVYNEADMAKAVFKGLRKWYINIIRTCDRAYERAYENEVA